MSARVLSACVQALKPGYPSFSQIVRDLALAKLLVKLSMGEYKPGFHIHLRSDFSGDAGQRDVLTILLDESVDGVDERERVS